jgi:hypothetical protein
MTSAQWANLREYQQRRVARASPHNRPKELEYLEQVQAAERRAREREAAGVPEED